MSGPAGRQPGRWWRARSPLARIGLAVGGLVLGVNALLAGVEAAVGKDPGGPASSSYATAPGGLAAYADLLAARGHGVTRLRVPLREAVAGLDPSATLVVAEPRGVTDADAEAVARFVNGGGRLVVTGRGSPSLLRSHGTVGLRWSARGAEQHAPVAPVPEVAGVTAVRAVGVGAWAGAGGALPVLASPGPGAVLAAVFPSGGGRVVALADTSPLQNGLLAEADNAAFGLAVAGPPGRPVVFAEAHHGYGRGVGLAAIPARWKWALAGAALAAAVALWAQGRRFGPPEDIERVLPPPRRAYADALAATLARTRRPGEALRPLQEAARRRLARRAGLDEAAATDDAELRQAGARLALGPEEIEAIVVAPRSDEQVLALGRAVARLEGDRP